MNGKEVSVNYADWADRDRSDESIGKCMLRVHSEVENSTAVLLVPVVVHHVVRQRGKEFAWIGLSGGVIFDVGGVGGGSMWASVDSLVAEEGWLGEPTTRVNNIRSHFFGSINGRTRCLSCDIGGYEADKERCPKKEQRDIDFAKVDAIKAEKESV